MNWGRKVTVCIAVVCDRRSKIITVSDMKTTFGGLYSADEISLKVKALIHNWLILQAGNDITDANPIIERARSILAGRAEPSPSEVVAAVHKAHQERHCEQVESQALAKYGLTLPTFLKDGKRKLTEQVFNRIGDSISRVSISLEFLLAGFDSAGEGHIWHVSGCQQPANYDDVGFCSIGTGMEGAFNALAFHVGRNQLSAYGSWEQAVYCACDAKFRAETASDVGRSTFLTISARDSDVQFISPMRIEKDVRKHWERRGAHRLSPSIINLIPGLVYTASELNTPDGLRKFVGRKSRRTPADMHRWFVALKRSFALHNATKVDAP
jgi:hypothetical protein